MPSYSIKEKLEALEVACRINNIPDDYKLELTNNILRSMGFSLEKPNEVKEEKINIRKKFICGKINEIVPFESLSLMLGFQLDEKSFIILSSKAAMKISASIILDKDDLYLEYKDGSKVLYKNKMGYNKDLAIALYDHFPIKSNSLDFGDICGNNNQ